ncbi:hypothetical protein Tco_1361364 [Tanacetum coccineum]
MSSIIAQQAKLDLELVPKGKRLEIGKCNGRLNPGKIQREPTFQVILDALALTPCYLEFLITADVPEVYMHQFWDLVYKHDTFYKFKMDKRKRFKLNLEIFRYIFKICPRVQGQDVDALPNDEKIMSFLRELSHNGKINSLNDVVVDQMHQPWRTFASLINKSLSGKTTAREDVLPLIHQSYHSPLPYLRQDNLLEKQDRDAILPKSLKSPEMKETKAYKTYLGFATGATPPKKPRKFKKPASPQLSTVLVSSEEPMKKSNRVKRSAKKSTKAPTGGVVIRETPEMPLSKKKEKVDVARGKGIELLSDVALTEEAYNNEQDSRSEGSDEENDSDDKNTQSDNEKGSDSEHETDENESDSESDHQENEEEDENDEEEVKDELVKTPSNDSDDEAKITDKAEGDEDEEMDYTTSQLYDDVDIRLNEPVQAGDETIQKKGTDVELTNIQQGNENLEISQVIEDAHVTLSTVAKKTEVPVTSSSHSSDLAAKFLNFSDIPHTYVEIVSPMDVHVHHEVPSQQTPTLLTVPVSVIIDSSLVFSTIIPQSLPSFTPPPQQLISTPPQKLKLQILNLHFWISHQSLMCLVTTSFKFTTRITK